MTSLEKNRCLPCEGMSKPLDSSSQQQHLKQLGQDWAINTDNQFIYKKFSFKNYYQTIAFVNAIAWMANLENHHPDLEVSYNHCTVRYTTHAIHGLSENDFICAAKVNALYAPFAEKYEGKL